jgi:peroxiredoxin Q/BCP
MREFRVHHEAFRKLGVLVAGVSRERWTSTASSMERLQLPFPLLSDEDGAVMRALAIVRPVPLGPWTIEFVRRTTLLVDIHAEIAAVWGKVKIRGHAEDVLRVARVMQRSSGQAP